MKLAYDDCLALARVQRYPCRNSVLEFNAKGKLVGFTQSFSPEHFIHSPAFSRWCDALRPWVSSYGFDLEVDLPSLAESYWVSPCGTLPDTFDRKSSRLLTPTEFAQCQSAVEKFSGVKYTLDLTQHNVVYLGLMKRRPVELRAVVTFETFDVTGEHVPFLKEQSDFLLGSFGHQPAIYGQTWKGVFTPELAAWFTSQGMWLPECREKLARYAGQGGFLFWKLSPGPVAKFYAMFNS